MSFPYKTIFGGVLLAASLHAHAGMIVNAPASAIVGSNFDVELDFDQLGLGANEAVIGFDFVVSTDANISFVGAAVDAAFTDTTLGSTVGGLSFAGVIADPIDLAILTFSADIAGFGSGDFLGLGSALIPAGVQIQDSLTFATRFLDIDDGFRLEINDASNVPVPGTLALLALGLVGWRACRRGC